jgi:hypothetical protein
LSTEIKDQCRVMSAMNEIFAGFVDDKNYDEFEDEIEEWIWWRRMLWLLPLAIVVVVLLMGNDILSYLAFISFTINHL